jgi:xanthine/CO dehydrogenase XdhC/CoxF family maturation factor
MWILAERGDDALTIGGRDRLEELASAEAGASGPLAIETRFRQTGKRYEFVSRSLEPAAGAPTPRMLRLDGGDNALVDVIAAKPRLVIAGGGHVSLAIVRQAELLDFDVTVLEDRPHFAGKARFPGATVVEADVAETIASLDYGWHTFLVIATRGHKMDADCTLAAVRSGVRYIGLLGSRRKKVMIDEMLREQGIDEARIQSIRSPVGLNLGGRTPAEIALAVMAEITQIRYASHQHQP